MDIDLADPQIWISLLTLSVLEVVLGIDNIIFLSITADRLPSPGRERARRLGILLALVARLALLASIAWVVGLKTTIVEIGGFALSWRDLILIAGGLFLLAKGTSEIHHAVEGGGGGKPTRAGSVTFGAVVGQIIVLDVVFSLDSIITAVGMTPHLPVMAAAVIVAMAVMAFAAAPVAGFIRRHPTIKMLALSFLLLIGVALVADGLHFHIPKGYLYFAVAFSIAVESLNLAAASRRGRKA